ncbi:hypothetical protein DPMN_185659 [Dreissena polymorpha]|uniref:Uncharacterized protein n=1 Tax=Dreissena polymorpha TaxID=45954 RepID=A0A9D4DP03_DREPO|nr:hypothetical protein DPMN_185659 [Dreissena polymorpha]
MHTYQLVPEGIGVVRQSVVLTILTSRKSDRDASTVLVHVHFQGDVGVRHQAGLLMPLLPCDAAQTTGNPDP